MTLEEIKAAVDAGQSVHCANTGYRVHRGDLGQYLITFLPNSSSIGLTNLSGHRLNGKEAEFFVARSEDVAENPGRQIKTRRAGEGRSTRGRGGTPTQTASRSRGRGIKGKQAF